jgi:single-strand DNA-binding protein
MKDKNQIQLVGYVGADPQVRTHEDGKRVYLSIATHAPKYRKDNSGEVSYTTTWHNVVAWRRQAEYAEGNFVKGSRILVDGKIIYRRYKNKSGINCSTTQIDALNLINLDR